MLTSATSGPTTKSEPPTAPSSVGAVTRGSLPIPSRSLVKGVPVSAGSDETPNCSVPLSRIVERDALEPAPHHTAADLRVLEILRRARDCAADLELESQGDRPLHGARLTISTALAICFRALLSIPLLRRERPLRCACLAQSARA
ncbi:unnamed protein product [Schistocephalus solidus]|uniref:ANK_REP_REGION domain-containing protein n=1 Tax=Schistocephalus solidus TaxID=70667 RepID=A0A183SNV2_SCHSO|nr:unnamed protein product [Schistocephalus solidus]